MLWGGGIEFLSFPGSGNQSFTGYLFAVTNGRDEILSLGKQIADEAEDTILGEVPVSINERIPFKHNIIDTAFGGIRRDGDTGGDGDLDIVANRNWNQARLKIWENQLLKNPDR